MAPSLLPQLSVDWGPVSAWVAAGVTFLAVLVAFGVRDWLKRPRLKITFQDAEPHCRFTDLTIGRKGYWVRVRVENTGINPARACVGTATEVRTADELRSDIDPMRLRWCGVEDALGFQPIHLAKGQYEYLDVFRIVQGDRRLWFETFPPDRYAPGHDTFLAPDKSHRVCVSVVSDNAHPLDIWLTIMYTGDFDALPASLTVSAPA